MEIEEKYTFDLTKMYKDLNEFDKCLNDAKKYLVAFDKFKGKLNNKEILLNYFIQMSEMKVQVYSLLDFINTSADLKMNDNDIKVRKNMLESFLNEFSVNNVPIDVELSKLDDKLLDDCINDIRFKDYKIKLESIKRNKVHTLSEKEENIVALMGSFSSGFEDIYKNIMNNDLSYEPVMVDGKLEKLTKSNLLTFYKNKNEEVRKQAFLNVNKAISNRANSAITAYIYKLKQECFDLKLRNYSTVLDAVLDGEQIPKEVYYKLIDKTLENVGIIEKFNKIKQKALGLKEYHSYDSYLPISSGVDKKLSIERQLEIMREALKPLGEKYVSNIDLALKERWFDLYPDEKNKVNNTYANADYRTKQPLIFMHQNYDFDSLGALIHEFGHAVNFKYSIENQIVDNYGNSIYNAEIASTVNEILLANYLYQNAQNEDEKIFYLEQMIDNFIGTVMIQAKFSMFEDFAYKLVENDEPITVDILCDKWYEINNQFNGKSFDKIEEEKQFKKGAGFISIHHFVYYTYYVFNYATSYTCAYYIANKLLSGDKKMQEDYLKFLAKGASEYPNAQCEAMGIKLQTGKPFDVLYKDMNDKLCELDRLVTLRRLKELEKQNKQNKFEETKKNKKLKKVDNAIDNEKTTCSSSKEIWVKIYF